MKFILILLSISIVAKPGMTESCQNSRELESSCGNYCFKIVRPVLDHTKALQNQVENFSKSTESKIQKQLEFLDTKMEDLHRSTGKELEVIHKQLKDLSRLLEVKKPTVGKPFQKIGSKYYYIEKSETLSWHAAGNKCHLLGGHLVNFKHHTEFYAILANLEPRKRYWIDLNDIGSEGTYVSGTTGQRAIYLNFHPGNPDNSNNSEHCVEILYEKEKHLMNDANCSTELLFICEPDDQ